MRILYIVFSIFFIWSFIERKENDPIKTKEDLGKKLFFEKKLSKDNSISCGSCHRPEFAFADTVAFSKGVYNRIGKRNTPSSMNMASREIFFFDGRAATLEEQAVFPIEDHLEMDILIDKAVQKIATDKNYNTLFNKIYKTKPTKSNILDALASFQKSLETTSPFDEYIAGDTSAISASAIRGHKLFIDPKNKCFECHFTPDFTADEFRNVGLFDGKKLNDSGRYAITKNPNDIGKFKVPGLRNVAITAPYMHNGMFKTLEEVVDYYNNPYLTVSQPINIDTLLLQPLHLTEENKKDLVSFLKTLTDPQFKNKLKD
jgi:cytochrome c peroxidase